MSRPRVLLVEDEALVAMMMEDVLEDLGWEVAGSFGDVRPTLDWLANHDLDAAVLDINLGAEMVFPIAEVLKARGTPFTFLTGYTAPPRAGEFSNPILNKPVDVDQLERVLEGFRPAA
jgi:two-component SAPR family response regulator